MEAVSSDFIKACLQEPGNFVCKAYRSDIITHHSAIEQLFANFYRSEPYEFLISTSHKEELEVIESYFIEHKDKFEAHIEKEHGEPMTKLSLNRNCENYCIGRVFGLFIDCIKEYFSTIHQGFFIHDDSEIMGNMLEIYNNYMKFVVLMENRLPTLSKLIRKIQSTVYPFSLWKFLYTQFLEIALLPVKEQLIEIFVKEIRSVRKNGITKILENKKLLYANYDQICILHGIAFLLACDSIDERSVYFLGTSNGLLNKGAYELTEQLLKAQTKDLYIECNTKDIKSKWKLIVNSDIDLLERILLPPSLKGIIKNCIETAKELWNFDATEMNYKFDQYKFKDLQVLYYAKKLGIKLNK